MIKIIEMVLEIKEEELHKAIRSGMEEILFKESEI